MTARFSLGNLVATRGAISAMADAGIGPLDLLGRHASGDWGCLPDDDKRANEVALRTEQRIISAYLIGDVKLYVITEHDRSFTTILRSDEY